VAGFSYPRTAIFRTERRCLERWAGGLTSPNSSRSSRPSKATKRLTDAFSKKWENHEAALALFFAYYNFCRVHSTIKTTPAVAAGLADRPWSVRQLLDAIAPPVHGADG